MTKPSAKKSARKLPITIGVVNQKGGVGKTTVTMMLAFQLAREGKNVIIHDKDSGGTAMSWDKAATNLGQPLPFDVAHSDNFGLLTSQTDYDFVIADNPPNNELLLTTMAATADYLVIPLLPGGVEIDRVGLTKEIMAKEEGARETTLRYGYVLNSVGNNNITKETEKHMKELGYPVLTSIPRRVAYSEAYGKHLRGDLLLPAEDILRNLGIKL